MEYILRLLRQADAACRLGPGPVLRLAWHRGPIARLQAQHALADQPAPLGASMGASWPRQAPPPPPGLPAAHRAAVLARAASLGEAGWDWHGSFPPAPPALSLDLFGPGDIRPVWERNRWAELPLLAQAALLEPAGGWSHRAAGFLGDWAAANPAFHGPNWACGQEAALRVLHLALALGLLGAAPPPGARRLLALHGRRIAATPSYALAQDNNHGISEPAGLLVCGLLLQDAGWVATGEARLAAARRRLIAADGSFAQLSTGYHRLLLDVLAVTEWLRRRHGLPAIAEPGAVRWLHRLVDPVTGAMPRLGHQDGSAFGDLALGGPADARPSLERAARLLAGASAGCDLDPGCAWLGLPAAPASPPPDPAWVTAGLRGWQAGAARGFLRTGPLRFRPGHADLLHFDLWDGSRNLLRDGGTGAYNPWNPALAGTAGHNTVEFDGRDQMPAVSRFLFARWPRGGLLPQGGWIRDHRGNRHERRVTLAGRLWRIEDRLAGPWRTAALRWRLAPGPWRLTADGAAGPFASLRITADGPMTLALEAGEESLAYGVRAPVPLLVARIARPVRRLATIIALPD